MTPSATERIAVIETLMKEHKKDFDEFKIEVHAALSTHDTKDQSRTDGIMSKIGDMEKKFDNTYVQRKEVWAISSFIGFLVTLIWLTKVFITKQ